MSESRTDDRLSLEDLISSQGESDEKAYLAWKERKIRKALETAKDRSAMIPAKSVWEKLGLER